MLFYAGFRINKSFQQKLDLLCKLGATRTVVIGNGADDIPMMEEVGLGTYIMSQKGIFLEAMNKADVVSMNILDALDFLLRPLRQKPL